VIRFVALALGALLLTGCATTRAPSYDADAARLILVTVANPPEALTMRAGSTRHGYDGAGAWGVSAQARATASAIASEYALREVSAWPIAPLEVHCVVFEIAAGAQRAEVLERLGHDPRVRLAQAMQQFSTLSSAYNDPYVDLQRGFAEIRAPQAQRWSRGDGVKVAVIDTGVDTGHADIGARVHRRANFVDADDARFAGDRHGTAVAGIIGAVANNKLGIVGVAPQVELLAFKACWQLAEDPQQARCNSFTLAQALAAALEDGAQVINLSLGGPADPLLAQLVTHALAAGALVVGAVPPDGALDGFPVGVPGVIAVTEATATAPPGSVLAAPGSGVLSLTPGGHYDYSSGSSLAAAHVSGTLALMLAASPKLRADAAFDLLRRTSAPREHVASLIDACAALAALVAGAGCDDAPGDRVAASTGR
jgi:subtilisin family serine protease